jgi:N6-L-threonylcarbamoyladenine synthase
MLVLGLESSCDETGLALVECRSGGQSVIVAEVLSSQVKLHEEYGGVVPELASREHLKNLPVLFNELFRQAGCSLADVDAIGVTCGPGLKGCLLVGVTFAQGLSISSSIPLFPVNHIEGHILSAQMHFPELVPPYVALVVSGGHTEIILVEGIGRYRCLCRTQDDAAGEAFDKSANLLGLGYPGGAVLASLADSYSGQSRFSLPKVAREIDSFSFSGLKTAISLIVKKHQQELQEDESVLGEMAWSIQNAIIDSLVHKTIKALSAENLPLVICGGVSANKELRRRLQAAHGDVYVPPLKHCVDNGAMIAFAAGCHVLQGHVPTGLDIFSRWPVESLRYFYGLEI